jgi:hypothetical protein
MENKIDLSGLLTREEFKRYGFKRTNGKCCMLEWFTALLQSFVLCSVD